MVTRGQSHAWERLVFWPSWAAVDMTSIDLFFNGFAWLHPLLR